MIVSFWLGPLFKRNPTGWQQYFSSPIFFPIPPHDLIDSAFKTGDESKIFSAVNRYVSEYGLGIFENHVCFKVDSATDRLVPIEAQSYKTMDGLVGHER